MKIYRVRDSADLSGTSRITCHLEHTDKVIEEWEVEVKEGSEQTLLACIDDTRPLSF